MCLQYEIRCLLVNLKPGAFVIKDEMDDSLIIAFIVGPGKSFNVILFLFNF